VVPVANSAWLRPGQYRLIDQLGQRTLLSSARVPEVRSAKLLRSLGRSGLVCSMGRKRRQSHFEGLLDALGVRRSLTVLCAQVSVCPIRGVITRAEFVDFGEKPIAQFGRCLSTEDWLGAS
jgi:hypothetical protein